LAAVPHVAVTGGIVDKTLPHGLMFVGSGSKGDFVSFLVPNTFQTMLPYEFLADRYIHLFYSHNFGSLLFRTKHWRTELKIAYNAAFGTLKNPTAYGIDFKTANKIFQETGLIISKLYSFPIFNMFSFDCGVGAFYRFGYYKQRDIKDNIALKLQFGISF
jgi:hypothetical protein